MELDRFQVLKSYADSIKTLAQADKWVAYELSYLVIMFGIFWELPDESKTNPIAMALFNQIKIPIANWRKQALNGLKGWRPKKSFENLENSRKPNSNPTHNPSETQPESQPITQPKENIKIKNIKIKENIKRNYWEFVLLSDDEYLKLKEIFWEPRLRQIINEMNNSIGAKWYKYKSHYFAIRKRFSDEIKNLESKTQKKTEWIPDYDSLDPLLS